MKKLIIVAGAALALGGCSTIVDGQSQTIGVNTSPTGARCELMREGAQIGVVDPTPGTVTIDKTKYDIIVNCSKEGYQDASFVNKSDVNAATFGNILIGGGIGWAIDSATGSDNKYQGTVSMTLAEEGDEPAVVSEPEPNIAQSAGEKTSALMN